jgi:hypothetical protein
MPIGNYGRPLCQNRPDYKLLHCCICQPWRATDTCGDGFPLHFLYFREFSAEVDISVFTRCNTLSCLTLIAARPGTRELEAFCSYDLAFSVADLQF